MTNIYATNRDFIAHLRTAHAELLTKNGGVRLPNILDFHYRPFEEDVLIMGAGGTGKTYLLSNLFLQNATYPLWLWDFRWQYGSLARVGFHIAHFPYELPYGRAVLQPHSSDLDTFDAFCSRAESLTNLVVAIEEAHLFTTKFSFKSKGFERIIKAGRPKGISWVCITRRPQQLHNDILSDADHIFCFRLELPNDILYVSKWLGQEVQLHLDPKYRTVPQLKGQPQLPPHSFVYKSVPESRTDVGKL